MHDRLIEGPQGRLNVSETPGAGLPVIFLHSDGGDLRHWYGIRERIADHPTAAFDRRGHGRSDQPRSRSFYHPDAAADVGAVANALGYRRFILVGHSGGALTAFAYASGNRDRVASLVLVDPPPDPAVMPSGVMQKTLERLRGPAYAAAIEEHYRGIAGDNPAVVGRVLNDIRATPKATVIGTFEAMAQFRPRNYLSYNGPALSIIQPQNDANGALHRLAQIEHVVIEGSGHWIHLASPDRFLDVFEDFISDCVRPDDALANISALQPPAAG